MMRQMYETNRSSVLSRGIGGALLLFVVAGLAGCGKPPQPTPSVLPTPVHFNEMGEPATGPVEPLVIPSPRPPRPLVRPAQT